MLVVEGHGDTLELNQRLLWMHGADVRAASSGAEALRLLDAWHPRALLTELHLPDMSAYDLARRVNERAASPIRMVAASADARPSERERALRDGFCAYLTKPIHPDDLCRALARVLAQSLLSF